MTEFEIFWKKHGKYLDLVLQDDIKNELKYKEFAKIFWEQAKHEYHHVGRYNENDYDYYEKTNISN